MVKTGLNPKIILTQTRKNIKLIPISGHTTGIRMIKENKNGCLIDVEIKPNSKEFEIGTIDPWQNRLRIKVKKPPIDNKANKELLQELKKLTGAEVTIEKGQKSTKKTLHITITKKELKKRLNL